MGGASSVILSVWRAEILSDNRDQGRATHPPYPGRETWTLLNHSLLAGTKDSPAPSCHHTTPGITVEGDVADVTGKSAGKDWKKVPGPVGVAVCA